MHARDSASACRHRHEQRRPPPAATVLPSRINKATELDRNVRGLSIVHIRVGQLHGGDGGVVSDIMLSGVLCATMWVRGYVGAGVSAAPVGRACRRRGRGRCRGRWIASTPRLRRRSLRRCSAPAARAARQRAPGRPRSQGRSPRRAETSAGGAAWSKRERRPGGRLRPLMSEELLTAGLTNMKPWDGIIATAPAAEEAQCQRSKVAAKAQWCCS